MKPKSTDFPSIAISILYDYDILLLKRNLSFQLPQIYMRRKLANARPKLINATFVTTFYMY